MCVDIHVLVFTCFFFLEKVYLFIIILFLLRYDASNFVGKMLSSRRVSFATSALAARKLKRDELFRIVYLQRISFLVCLFVEVFFFFVIYELYVKLKASDLTRNYTKHAKKQKYIAEHLHAAVSLSSNSCRRYVIGKGAKRVCLRHGIGSDKRRMKSFVAKMRNVPSHRRKKSKTNFYFSTPALIYIGIVYVPCVLIIFEILQLFSSAINHGTRASLLFITLAYRYRRSWNMKPLTKEKIRKPIDRCIRNSNEMLVVREPGSQHDVHFPAHPPRRSSDIIF